MFTYKKTELIPPPPKKSEGVKLDLSEVWRLTDYWETELLCAIESADVAQAARAVIEALITDPNSLPRSR